MKILNSFQIKLFMTVLMTLDHLAPLLDYEWARAFHILSRPVAVWFAFAAVESLYHTRSRRDYLLRLYGAAAFMQAGNLVLQWLMRAKPELVPDNNIFLTLAVGATVIVLMEHSETRRIHWIVAAAAAAVFMSIACEGGLLLLVTMMTCWALRESPGVRSGVLAIAFVLLAGRPTYYPTFGMTVLEYLADSTLACLAVLPFLHLYNGRRGPDHAFSRWFFYLWYPAHIWLIAAAAFKFL